MADMPMVIRLLIEKEEDQAACVIRPEDRSDFISMFNATLKYNQHCQLYKPAVDGLQRIHKILKKPGTEDLKTEKEIVAHALIVLSKYNTPQSRLSARDRFIAPFNMMPSDQMFEYSYALAVFCN